MNKLTLCVAGLLAVGAFAIADPVGVKPKSELDLAVETAQKDLVAARKGLVEAMAEIGEMPAERQQLLAEARQVLHASPAMNGFTKLLNKGGYGAHMAAALERFENGNTAAAALLQEVGDTYAFVLQNLCGMRGKNADTKGAAYKAPSFKSAAEVQTALAAFQKECAGCANCGDCANCADCSDCEIQCEEAPANTGDAPTKASGEGCEKGGDQVKASRDYLKANDPACKAMANTFARIAAASDFIAVKLKVGGTESARDQAFALAQQTRFAIVPATASNCCGGTGDCCGGASAPTGTNGTAAKAAPQAPAAPS